MFAPVSGKWIGSNFHAFLCSNLPIVYPICRIPEMKLCEFFYNVNKQAKVECKSIFM